MTFTYEDYRELTRLDKELSRLNLEFGDPRIARYNTLVEKYQKSPFDIHQLFAFVKQAEQSARKELSDQVEDLRHELSAKERELQEVARLMQPYLQK